MIRFVFRFIGLWILAVAFVALIRDGTKTIAGTKMVATKLLDDWSTYNLATLERTKAAVLAYSEWLWNPVLQSVLDQPSWLVLGIIGAILILLGRKKKPLIGYARGD